MSLGKRKQCAAVVNGERCERWATSGQVRCHVCIKVMRSDLARLDGKMSRTYRNISRVLEDRLIELEAAQSQVLSLREEVSLVRASADAAVKQFGEALELKQAAERAFAENPTEKSEANHKRARELHDVAAAEMRAVLSEVRTAVLDAAKLEATIGDKFTADAARLLLTQAADLLREVCGIEHQSIAQEFEELLPKRIGLNGDGLSGTSHTPDQDVAEMDKTIPGRLEESAA